MVIKGKSVAGATRVALHLARTDTNERMEVKELKGVAAENMPDALREMEAVASANPNCEKPFWGKVGIRVKMGHRAVLNGSGFGSRGGGSSVISRAKRPKRRI